MSGSRSLKRAVQSSDDESSVDGKSGFSEQSSFSRPARKKRQIYHGSDNDNDNDDDDDDDDEDDQEEDAADADAQDESPEDESSGSSFESDNSGSESDQEPKTKQSTRKKGKPASPKTTNKKKTPAATASKPKATNSARRASKPVAAAPASPLPTANSSVSTSPAALPAAAPAVSPLRVSDAPPMVPTRVNGTANPSNNEDTQKNDKENEPVAPMDLDRATDAAETTPAPSKPTKKPRLVITHMVLCDFKSYAGRQVIGPFHKSFSAVVGPNGSGKSNVIDALLFVFGYRANKMRQGKLSELIHNSAKHPNVKECTVEVHFLEIVDGDTPGDVRTLPNSKLVVSRRAFDSNGSKYFINDRSSSYSEVTALLRQRGIDLDHKRFLILQGEVESIALMKPKAKDDSDDGLLEYLEDIIGTSKYKDAINAASARLDEINERRAEKLSRVKFVAKELGSLEDKKREAENYLENENNLSRRKNELYQVYRHEALVNQQVASMAIDELKVQLQEEEAKHESIIRELNGKEDEYKQATKQLKIHENEYTSVMKEHAKFEKTDVELRAKREHAVKKQEKDKEAQEKDREALAKAQSDIKKHTEDAERRRKDVKATKSQLKEEEEKLEEINEELKGKTEEFKAEIDEQQKALAPWSEQLIDKKQSINVKQSERKILETKIHAGEKAVEDASAQLDKLKKMRKRKMQELEKVPSDLQDLKSEIADLELKIKDANEREVLFRKDLGAARQKADEARASMQHSQNRGKVLDALIRMRESGRIKGIYDRMGNLGVIDDKYDVAISTACPALDNIVVESVEAAQACIEHLRKNQLGRAVFTVLEKVQYATSQPVDAPEGVPRLYDLVRPREEKFAPAFYSVLRDTLVAQDLQQANRIAYGRQRWRVVTLDGKLIERSGAMSGGGRPARGAMGSQFKGDVVAPETVAALETERDELEREYRDIVEEKRSLEIVLRNKHQSLPKLEVTLEKLQMDARAIDSQIDDDTKRLDELKMEVQPSQEDVDRVAEIDDEIKELEAEMETIQVTVDEIDEKIKDLQDEIMEAGGLDLRLQTVVVNDMRKKIDDHNSKITKAGVLKAKAEKDIIKLNKNLAKYEHDLAALAQEIDNFDAKLVQNNKDAANVMDRADVAKKAVEQQKAITNSLKKELDEDSAKIDAFKQMKVDMVNQLEDYQKTRSDNGKKAEHWEEQQTKLTLHKLWKSTKEDMTLPLFDEDKVKELQNEKQNLKGMIAEIEAFVQSAKPNLSVLEEYRRRDEEYKERSDDLDAVTRERDAVKGEADGLRKRRLDEFMHGFNIISQKLKEMYQMITLGGNAELELVDSLDPFSEGIVFSVMPPKKSWKNISNLSGGEKTLSSLALVFALHHFKPTPLYVMDEIDAALDFRNVSIVANYIAERTKDAQFIIISLRNNMFELADRLVGIYKTSNCTRSVAINPTMIATLTGLSQHEKSEKSKQQRAKRASSSSTPRPDVSQDTTTIALSQ